VTRIFIDTEFLEDGRTIDLISIGIVAENGDEYYAVIRDDGILHRAVNRDWLRENVISSLPVRVWQPSMYATWTGAWDENHPDFAAVKPREQIADEVRQFILSFPDPQLWAWYSAYDHVALCQLFGAMIDLPDGIPMFTNDLKQECVRLGDPRVPEQETGQHNALADARHNRDIAAFLQKQGASADDPQHRRCDNGGMKPWERHSDLTPYPGDETVWFDSFADLIENIRNNPEPLNEIVGWEWHRSSDLTEVDYSKGYPKSGEWFSVTVAMPRVRLYEDWSAPVSDQDESEVRAWLKAYGTARAQRWNLTDD
jgi:hypothetical protein